MIVSFPYAASGDSASGQQPIDPVSYGGHVYDLATASGRAQLIMVGANNLVPMGRGGSSMQQLLKAHPPAVTA